VLWASIDASGLPAVLPGALVRVSRGIDSEPVGRLMRDSTAIVRRPPTAGADRPPQGQGGKANSFSRLGVYTV